MTKGFCRCGAVMDETEATSHGVCDKCFEKGFHKIGGEAWERYFRSKPKKLTPEESRQFWNF